MTGGRRGGLSQGTEIYARQCARFLGQPGQANASTLHDSNGKNSLQRGRVLFRVLDDCAWTIVREHGCVPVGSCMVVRTCPVVVWIRMLGLPHLYAFHEGSVNLSAYVQFFIDLRGGHQLVRKEGGWQRRGGE